MTTQEKRTVTESSTDLFDKYTLPKVALVVILAAALVGTWVTSSLAGRSGPVFSLAKWSYFVALGVLAGGLVWKHVFVRPLDLGDGTGGYCAEMYERFDRIAAGAVVVAGVGGAVVLYSYVGRFGLGPSLVGYAGLLFGLLGLTALTVPRDRSVADQFRSPAGVATLALALAVVVATAVLEVALRGVDPLAVGVRILHLLAYSVWIGGAVWNIFVAVPTGQKRPTVPVVRAAGAQLERFRWAVRFVIPTLVLTGLYQAVDAIGIRLGAYLASTVGLAIVAKLGFIALLVVIFMLCPMWRACSPIDGVCDLEDLDRSRPSGDRAVTIDD